MTTKVTRDVWDGRIRPIVDGIDVDGDCSANFQIDGTTVGLTTPCDAAFVNLTVTNLDVTGTFDATGATLTGTWAATYSDLAERYLSDKEYAPGTVVKIGGEAEITATTRAADPDVFGVISTAPAYVLNSGKEGLYQPVVLTGRVPVRVIGPIVKGDRLIASNIPGVARAAKPNEKGCAAPTFGRSLENSEAEEERLVEVAFVTIK